MKQLLIVNIALPFYLFVDHHKTGQPKTIDALGKGIERNAHTGVTFARFQGHILSYLNITALGVDYVHSSVDCGLACISTPSCLSFNLAAVIEMNSKILCELLPSDIFNNSDKLVANHLFHHFSIWSPCLNKPCQNNGSCRSNYERDSYVCVCTEKYTGSNCETHIDGCAKHPCSNNGTCSDHVDGFKCICPAGFEGSRCEIVTVAVNRSCENSTVWPLLNGDVIIESNQIGSSYHDDMDCHWKLSSNTRIELVFIHFDLEAKHDYVEIYDGGSLSAPLIDRINGSSTPSPVTSSSKKLFLRFKTDHSVIRTGFRARFRALTDGALRIAGHNASSGRIEVFFDNQWGTVCDNGWDIDDALVSCKQIGFDRASQAFSGASHGLGIGPIWMNDVACFGNESLISGCGHGGWGTHENCTHSQDASVTCSYDSLPIRLVNGGARYGRVEVFHNGLWGTICDVSWDMNDANVACRQLNFTGASYVNVSATYGQGSGPIWRDRINCQGSESSLFDCPFTQEGFGYCSHSQDSAVVCY
ncbi:Scavenger receptor cysteine-rich type 1 protein M130 [Stylophora pistillata]|uniref:Scavenger receptor cysteine-rich type 1 protein M130 n=1 Tax=Stylophora pistillata TaxID=50429 RepID=A0A2B4SKP2_STYPI|nr:Scavenger receptor cysteine-rich type 1 protein M130 [Stylophora pistillata]